MIKNEQGRQTKEQPQSVKIDLGIKRINKNKSSIDLGLGGATEERLNKGKGAVKDKNVLSSRNTLSKKGRMMVPECEPKEIEAFI